jgi:hypothetical protein
MIGGAITAARLWFAELPSGIRWALAGIAAALVLAVVWATWLHFHDAGVIEQHEVKREAAAAPARELSAEERAVDALANQMAKGQRDQAIVKAAASEAAKPPEARATIPPTTIARRCVQLLRAYSSEQLARMPAYQEKCR